VLTLHDCWLLGGHCAHSFDCKRWRTGCGNCPGLNIPNRIRRDASAANWADRRAIFSQFQYRVSAPCQWLMDKVNASLLADNMLEGRVIPNGVDLRTFYPADKKEARTRLRLDLEAKIVLLVGTHTHSSPWRDYSMLEKALSRPEQEVMLLCVGEEGEPLNDGRLKVRSLGPINEPARMADLYRAADVYAHPAIQDTFPTTALEAMACGVPVVATSVGGIPEQIKEGVTGHLVPSGDVTAMRARLMNLLNDDVVRERMGRRAGEIAAERFDIVKQARTYVEWFRQLT